MDKSVLSPTLSEGQVEKILNDFKGILLKYHEGFNKDGVQKSLPGLAQALFRTFREHVEMHPKIFSCKVKKVDRNQTPKAMLHATGSRPAFDKDVIETMPRGEGEEKEVFFFQVDDYDFDHLEKVYESLGLKPVDPFSLGAVNQDNPLFSASHPNITWWKNEKGKWCVELFYLSDNGQPTVLVTSTRLSFDCRVWFAGIPK